MQGGNPNRLYPINLFRVGYGFTACFYLLAIVILFSVTYPMLMKDGVIFDSTYGVIMCWNLSKLFLLSLVVLCCLCYTIPLYMAMLCASAAGTVLLGSLAFLILLSLDALFVANTSGADPRHPANSPLFCCVFYETNPACLNLGPCINVNLTQSNIPSSLVGYSSEEARENITFVTKEHLRLDFIFQFSLYLTMIIFVLEGIIFFAFTLILRSVNSGKGIFYDIPIEVNKGAVPEDFNEVNNMGTKLIWQRPSRVPLNSTKKKEDEKQQQQPTEGDSDDEVQQQDVPSGTTNKSLTAKVRSRFKTPHNRGTTKPSTSDEEESKWDNRGSNMDSDSNKRKPGRPSRFNMLRTTCQGGFIRVAGWLRRRWFELGVLAKSVLILNSEVQEQQEDILTEEPRHYNMQSNNVPPAQQSNKYYFAQPPPPPLQAFRPPPPQYYSSSPYQAPHEFLHSSQQYSHHHHHQKQQYQHTDMNSTNNDNGSSSEFYQRFDFPADAIDRW